MTTRMILIRGFWIILGLLALLAGTAALAPAFAPVEEESCFILLLGTAGDRAVISIPVRGEYHRAVLEINEEGEIMSFEVSPQGEPWESTTPPSWATGPEFDLYIHGRDVTQQVCSWVDLIP